MNLTKLKWTALSCLVLSTGRAETKATAAPSTLSAPATATPEPDPVAEADVRQDGQLRQLDQQLSRMIAQPTDLGLRDLVQLSINMRSLEAHALDPVFRLTAGRSVRSSASAERELHAELMDHLDKIVTAASEALAEFEAKDLKQAKGRLEFAAKEDAKAHHVLVAKRKARDAHGLRQKKDCKGKQGGEIDRQPEHKNDVRPKSDKRR